jgi:hypothetical protein
MDTIQTLDNSERCEHGDRMEHEVGLGRGGQHSIGNELCSWAFKAL